MDRKLLIKASAALTAFVLCIFSGCGAVSTTHISSGAAPSSTNETKEFSEIAVTTPECIEGVQFLSKKNTLYKGSSLFDKVVVYNYSLDRNYFSVTSKLESKTILEQYRKYLEKSDNVLFNDDEKYGENGAICEFKSGDSSMYILVCNGDFDIGNNADFSVVLCTPKENIGYSDEEMEAFKDEPGSSSKNFVGYWKSMFYLFDDGSTSKTDSYSIFTYNTGSASLYVSYEKYAGTWKQSRKNYSFVFGDLNGVGSIETVEGKEYLVVDVDGVQGRVAFQMVS